MASINQVSIEVELKGQREVERGLKNLAKAQDGLERGIKASVDTNNRNAKSLDRIMREATKAQREMDRLAKALKEGQIASSQFHGETNKIAMRLKRLGMDKAQSEVTRYKNALLKAQKGSKLLSTATAKTSNALDRVSSDAQQAAAAMGRVGTAVGRGRNQFAEYDTSVYRANQQTKRFASVGLQQAGYQVGDFAVQLQSGTNAAVAFGQQGSQLLGIFGPAGAIAGAALAIGTAIVAPLIDARKRAEELTETLRNLSETYDDMSNVEKQMKAAFVTPFVEGNKELAEYLKTVDKLAQKAISEQVQTLFEGAPTLTERQEGGGPRVLVPGAEQQVAEELMALDNANKIYNDTVRATNILLEKMREQLKKGPEEATQSYQDLIMILSNQTNPKFQEMLQFVEKIGEELGIKVAIEKKANEEAQKSVTALENQYRLYAETRLESQQLNDEIERGLRNIAQGSVRLNQENQSILDQQIEMFRRTQKMKEEMGESAYEALRLSGNLNEVKDKSSEAANEAMRLRDALAEASAATQTLGLEVERKIAVIRARNKALQEGTNTAIAGEIALLRQKRNEISQNLAQQGATVDQIAEETAEISANIDEYEKLKNQNDKLRGSITKTGSATKKVTEETKKANKEYKTFNDILSDAYVTAGEFEQQMGQNVVSAIDSVSNAFADFVSRGFRDFSSFVDSVWSSFKNLLMQMIATAAKNRILISLGVTGGGLGGATAALAGGGGGPLGMLSSGAGGLGPIGSFLGMGALTGGAAAGGLLGGALGSVQGFLGGGLSGLGSAMSFGVSQGLSVGGLAGIGSAIGAIAGPIAIAAAAISFFSSKTKELDNGLKVTVGSVEDLTESMAEVESVSAKLKGTPIFSNKLQQQEQQKIQDTLDQIQKSAEEAAVNGQAVIIETFRKVEKSRFWGLSKSRRTQTDIASEETASPIREAIFNVQRSILDAAESLGVAADTFEGFSYDFKVSLKGLSEEEQMQAITEEINKMGDAFAALAPNIENMNELMTAAQQRYELETRLMQLQGKEAELLARRRQEELNGTHPLNIELLERIHLLEDQRVEEQKAAAIAQERYNLETQLLQLQGDTQELRKRELALLDESNRDLQKEIWALQDAQDAARAAERSQRDLVRAQEQAARSAEQMVNDLLGLVDEANFATRYGFEKTRGLVASGVIEDRTQIPRFADGGYHSGGARIVGEDGPELEITGPSRIISNKSLDNIASGNISVKSEISKMRQEMRAMMVQISKNTGKTSKQLDRWDRDGLPSDRGY